MRDSSYRTSGSTLLICPTCEAGELRSQGPGSARCLSCKEAVDGAMLLALWRIITLPDAVGAHACDCGHPEMRRLPDKAFWCPACGTEVRSVEAG